MVEIFKTNIKSKREAEFLKNKIAGYFPFYDINFDLNDWEKIMRIECDEINSNKVIEIAEKNGFKIQALED